MANKPSQDVNPELVATWLSRMRNLHSLIEADPSGSWTWLWRIRRDVIRYLLRRYGSEVTARDLLTSSMVEPSVQEPPVETTTAYTHETGRIEAKKKSPHAPRAQGEFRDWLDHIHEANEQVRLAQLDPRQRIVCLTYPESGFQLSDDHLRHQQRAIVQSEFDAIRELIAGSPDLEISDTSLTDDEIVAILCADAG